MLLLHHKILSLVSVTLTAVKCKNKIGYKTMYQKIKCYQNYIHSYNLPGYTELFNIKYENDEKIYTHKLLNNYENSDLEIIT